MIILDTDCLTLVQRAEGEEYARLAARLDEAGKTQPICVTIISFEEQMRGWMAYIARQRSPARQVGAYHHLNLLLEDFGGRQVLEFDDAARQVFEDLTRAKVRIGTMDLKIAAIALSGGAKLISRNLRDYRQVPGLVVEDWTAP
jgi:tRNA(fMet)-specific endonuclease VapC